MILNDPVGAESISGLICLEVNVVCLWCQPLDFVGGVGGVARGFLRVVVLDLV